MHTLPETVLALAERLYEAAVDPQVWPAFLDALADAVGGIAPGIFLSKRSTDETLWGVTSGQDPAWGKKYEAYYRNRDIRRPRIAALAAGEVFVGRAILPDQELQRSEFHNDFLRPQGYFQIAGAIPLKDDDVIAAVRVIRPRSAPLFDRQEVAVLRGLVPHVSRALRLQQQVAQAEARHCETAEALDWFFAGVILLDAGGRIVASNRTADEILTAGDGLRAGREGLRAGLPAETVALQRLVANATACLTSDESGEGVLNITRRAPRRPLSVLVAPLRGGRLCRAATHATVVVFVTDPERLQSPPVEHLRYWLGLTRAEAALVLELLRGRRVEEAAEVLGVSSHTARTQLKRALAKTGTGRQAELLRLALGTPVALSR